MSPALSVFVGGPPVPAARPRFDSRTRRTYTPTQYERYKHNVALILASRWQGRAPITRAVSVAVEVTLPRPQNKPAKGSLHRDYWTPEGVYPLPCRGDVDNYAKSALDALTQGGVIKDDRLVVELSVTKWAGDRPGLDIRVDVVYPEGPDLIP